MQNQYPKNNIIIGNIKPHLEDISQKISKELQLDRLSARKLVICENENKNTLFQINAPLIYKPVLRDYDTYSDTYQDEYCCAIAFNKESTVMVAGNCEKISVFDFKLGQLKLSQQLWEHKKIVTALYFMKLSNEFLSGSADNKILLWGINNNQKWYCKQQLKNGHTNYVSCVIMNTTEDLIISCSKDKCIKLWEKNDEWECSQTLICDTDCVSSSISLNDSQNQLVSCGNDKQILIFQVTLNKQWEKIQRIQVATSDARAFFIGDNLIAYQPYAEKMEIFELNLVTKQFIKSLEAKAADEFFCLYLHFLQFFDRDILETKTAYLMRKQNHNDFEIGWGQVWGTITDNAEYLVTWDRGNRQYQVIKKQE